MKVKVEHVVQVHYDRNKTQKERVEVEKEKEFEIVHAHTVADEKTISVFLKIRATYHEYILFYRLVIVRSNWFPS